MNNAYEVQRGQAMLGEAIQGRQKQRPINRQRPVVHRLRVLFPELAGILMLIIISVSLPHAQLILQCVEVAQASCTTRGVLKISIKQEKIEVLKAA